MNPSDIPRWLDEHGGADGPPQTDANGVTTHRARDGSYVTVYNGQVRMIGHGAPAGAPVNTEPTAAPAAGRGSGAMNHAELDAYIAAQAPGGDVNNWEFNRGTKTKEIQSAAGTRTVQVPFVQWIDRKTGRTLEYEVQPGGGSYTEVFNGVKPENKKDMQSTNDGPPGGKPYIDEEGPNGRRLGWNPATKQYDRDLGPSPSAQKGPNVERKTITRNGKVYIQVETKNPDGTSSLHFEDQQGNKVSLPDEVKAGDTKTESVKGSDGRIYTRVTTVSADGQATTVKNFGPDGKQVNEIPGEGPSRPTVSGPPLPQIVLGASQDAARTYKEQLQEGVAAGRWSQAWADSRWKEFMEVANLAVSEAATRQRNEESQRNAEFNIANARMGSMNTATSNALTFVNNINGYLPAGSNLGGQAFAALLGLNMLQSQMSGMNRIDPRRAPPQLTPAEISNPAALQARREQVQAQVQQASAPPVRDDYRTNPGQSPAPAPAPSPAPARVAPGQSPPAVPVRNPALVNTDPFDGATPVAAPAPAPAPAMSEPAPPDPFVGGRVLPQPPAEQGGPDPMDAAPPPAPYEETVTVRHRGLRGTRTVTRAYWEHYKAQHPWLSNMWVEGPAEPGAPPAPTTLDPSVPYPSNNDPNSEGVPQPVPEIRDPIDPTPPAVQKAMPNPAGEWAALAPMAPMPAPTQQQQQAPTGWGEPVAARRARIASMPPWRLSEDDLAWAEQNGFGQEAWGVPGRVA